MMVGAYDGASANCDYALKCRDTNDACPVKGGNINAADKA